MYQGNEIGVINEGMIFIFDSNVRLTLQNYSFVGVGWRKIGLELFNLKEVFVIMKKCRKFCPFDIFLYCYSS